MVVKRMVDTGSPVAVAEGKIIRAENYHGFVKGGEYLEVASLKAKNILEQAEKLYIKRVQAGYEEGRKRGEVEVTQKVIELTAERQRLFEEFEQEIVALVLSSTTKIIGELDDSERLGRLVLQALQRMRDEKQIKIKVAPDKVRLTKRYLEKVDLDQLSGRLLQIEGDKTLSGEQCVLESEYGVLDASLEVQLARLRHGINSALNNPNG